MNQFSFAGKIALLVSLQAITGCQSLQQAPDKVLSREPGESLLGHEMAVREAAMIHRDFAWLSVAAYGDDAKQGTPKERDGCPHPVEALSRGGWHRWENFPGAELGKRFKDSHLRVEVWEREEPAAIAIAFGGTEPTNLMDWLSNLRWFIPKHEDQYTQVVREFGPAFIMALEKRDHAFLKSAKLYATGHSLGGGLAQQFAYALPGNRAIRVDTAYTFDPSPVTGYYSVDENTREQNSRELKIERIYERGEFLASVRASMRSIYSLTASKPEIREIRYNLFDSKPSISLSRAVENHSMFRLACLMDKAVKGNVELVLKSD